MADTFEKNLKRLEEITQKLESSQTSLDAAIKLYKEGLELSKKCGERLNKYEAEITLLKKEFDGTFTQAVYKGDTVDDR